MRKLAILSAAGALVLAACGSDTGSDGDSGAGAGSDTPTIVVTYSVLGAVVEDLVGDRAEVQVIIPDGQDPHEFSPSAQDVEALNNADLVVSNGLDLEEPMVEAIEAAEAAGVAVFHAADHVTVRELGEDEQHAEGEQHGDDEEPKDEASKDEASKDEAHSEDEAHAHEGGDPHIWVDPLTMAEMVPALGEAIGAAVGADLAADVERVVAELTAADAAVADILAAIPAGGCKLVTGHDSLGYFADRYGCEVIGAIIPSLTTGAEASAKELAELRETAVAAGVSAVFTEPGTSADVADQIADEIGVPLVELPTLALPEDGSYTTFITTLAQVITDALA